MNMITRWMNERENFTTVIMDKMADRTLVNASDKGFLDIIKLFLPYRINCFESLIKPIRVAIVSESGVGIECALYLLKELKLHNVIGGKDETDRIFELFCISCSAGYIELVKQLHQDFQLDLNIHSPITKGQTPLVCAALSGQVEVMKYLVENGADINMPSTDGVVPVLHAALCGGNIVGLRYLVSSGADMNHTSQIATFNPFITYIMYVSRIEEESDESDEESETSDKEEQSESSEDDKNKNDTRTTRDKEIQKCEQIALEMLKGNMDVNSTIANGVTPLLTTILYGLPVSISAKLIELGADPWTPGPEGNSAVHFIFYRYLELLSSLLKNNSINVEQCVSTKNNAGLSPLELALTRNNSNLIGLLLSHMPELSDFMVFDKVALKHSEFHGGSGFNSWNCCVSTKTTKHHVLDGSKFCGVCKKQYGKDDDCVILHCDHMIHTDCQGVLLNSGTGNCPFCNEFFIKFNNNKIKN